MAMSSSKVQIVLNPSISQFLQVYGSAKTQFEGVHLHVVVVLVVRATGEVGPREDDAPVAGDVEYGRWTDDEQSGVALVTL